jgi:hypothetical protein
MVRAASTFDHAILFMVFCLAARHCFSGCILSLSSAAFMAFSIISVDEAVFMAMGAFWIVIATLSFAFFVITTNPLSRVISHLILDPQTGYFRMMIRDAARNCIALAPVTGYAYELLRYPRWGCHLATPFVAVWRPNVHFVISDKYSDTSLLTHRKFAI